MNVIEISSVTQVFSKNLSQKVILKDLNLTVRSGDFVWLKGISGSGKTTLLSLILGLISPTNGEIKLMGLPPKDTNSKLRVGVVFQEAQVPKNIKVRELVDLIGSYSLNSISTEDVLNHVNLVKPGILDTYASSLSGGEKQRLYFALALVGNPELLILDEPTRNLDPESRNIFWNQIKLCREKGVTVLMTTHNESDWQELNEFATQIVTLHEISIAPVEGQLIKEFTTLNVESTLESQSIKNNEEISTKIQSRNILHIFGNQFWFECLQLLRTPIFLLATLSFVGFIPLLKSQYQGKQAMEPLIYLCGIILFTITIERLGKRISIERAEGWLKLIKTTSIPPVIYMAAKSFSFLVVCSIGILSSFILGSWQLGIESSMGLWISIFLSLIIGIVPFTILGLGLGYWLNPKTADPILSLSLFIIPFVCGAVPLPFKPDLMAELVSLSPFYHYKALVFEVAQLNHDGEFFLHLLWLFWAFGVFGLSTIWIYQRDRVIQ
jgi:ABC-2 type transport system ATP-binding protein